MFPFLLSEPVHSIPGPFPLGGMLKWEIAGSKYFIQGPETCPRIEIGVQVRRGSLGGEKSCFVGFLGLA